MGRRKQNEKYEEKNRERRKNRVELQIGQKKKANWNAKVSFPSYLTIT